MYIETKEIGPDGLDFDRRIEYTLPRLPGGEEPIRLGTVHLTGELYRTDSGIAFTGDIETLAKLSCSRCLELYMFPLEVHFDLLYTTAREVVESGEGRVDDGSVTLARFDGSRIELEELLSEQIYLGLPLKPLCAADCHGLCSRCGMNLNLETCGCREEHAGDARLNVLKPPV